MFFSSTVVFAVNFEFGVSAGLDREVGGGFVGELVNCFFFDVRTSREFIL